MTDKEGRPEESPDIGQAPTEESPERELGDSIGATPEAVEEAEGYTDPETGAEETDPALRESETVQDEVEELLELLADTEIEVVSSQDGVVALSGEVATQEDLDTLVTEILGLDGIVEVDTSEVEVIG